MFARFWNRFNKLRSKGIRSATSIAKNLSGFEILEDRLCLSANPLVVNPVFEGISLTAVDFNPTSSGNQTAVQVPAAFSGKIDTILWSVLEDELSGASSAASTTADINAFTGMVKRSSLGDIEVVVDIDTWSATVLGDLQTLGIETTLSNESLQQVQGWGSATEINALLSESNVARVSIPDYGVTNAGLVDTEGDAILRSDEVRDIFAGLGIDGTGIKIGVISDGVDNRATVATTGDLPASITVNPSLPGGGDEGTAMLEIIHDMAPGAELFFSSGISGSLSMVNSVNWLVSQGVDIIVDDLSFFLQPNFEDGAIASTVASAISSGVSYFSSAGNQALDHYQAGFSFGATVTLNNVANEVHDFGGGALGLGVNIRGDGIPGVDVTPELNVFLQWSDPFAGSTNDYNLFLVDQNFNVLATSQPVLGTQNPVEQLAIDYSGSGVLTAFLVVGRIPGAANRELELFSLNDVGQQFNTPTDAIFGHQALTEIVSVAAINQADPGNDAIEVFSSRGPSTIYTNFSIQTSTARTSLDGAAIDGVQTRAGDLGLTNINGASLDPFFGTSAAAPHAAAIAALLLDVDPLLTPAQISTILADTAVDILATGYDSDSGAGRFDVYAAVTSILPPIVTDVFLFGSTWSGASPYSFDSIVSAGEQFKPIFTENVDRLQIQFSENVTFANNGAELQLLRKNGAEESFSGFSYDQGSFTATWTFSSELTADKYAIHLSDLTIKDDDLNRLDGDWKNDDNDAQGININTNTPDDITDDTGEAFWVGNGSAGSTNNEFRFHFAYLPGDYDGNGVVEHGSEAATGDGNGDGLVNSSDNNLGVNGEMLSLRAIGGADFTSTSGTIVEDEIVNDFDFIVWEQGLGDGSGVPGDADGDGDVDGLDFLFWQREYGAFSAWYEGTTSAGIGGTTAQFFVGLAPQITDVIISGSQSQHAAFAFSTVDGSGSQLTTVPVGGADTVSLTFSELVNISASSLSLIGLQTANIPELVEFSYDAFTMAASWRFEGWALGDQYLISVKDSVTDLEGNILDGEWVNPISTSTTNSLISTFPSGDGTAGGHFNFIATLLAGDANLDNVVDAADYSIMTNNWGLSGSTFVQGDFNGDGMVDAVDAGLQFENWDRNLQIVVVVGDANGDYIVDHQDTDAIDEYFGLVGATRAQGDLSGNGEVGIEDLDLAFAQFGLGFDWVS